MYHIPEENYVYFKLIDKYRNTCYIDIPHNPTISVFEENDEDGMPTGLWVCIILSQGAQMVLKSGTYSECHELANKILDLCADTPMGINDCP